MVSEVIRSKIDIFDENYEKKRKREELNIVSKWLQIELNLQNILTELMIAQGFTDIINIAYSNINELLAIDELNKKVAIKIIKRAKKFTKKTTKAK